MMEVKATWKGGFKFEGKDSSGRVMKMDASVERGARVTGSVLPNCL